MNPFVSSLKNLVQLPLIYIVSILLQAPAIWMGFVPNAWSLRGGMTVQILFQIIIWLISIGTIVQVGQSRCSKAAKIGLIALQGVGLSLLSLLICQMLPIVIFFGPGTCRTTTNSPSGQHSITIEDACYMGCSQSVYSNKFIFEHQMTVAPVLRDGRFCQANPVFTWNKTETEVQWKVRGESGTIKLE